MARSAGCLQPLERAELERPREEVAQLRMRGRRADDLERGRAHRREPDVQARAVTPDHEREGEKDGCLSFIPDNGSRGARACGLARRVM